MRSKRDIGLEAVPGQVAREVERLQAQRRARTKPTADAGAAYYSVQADAAAWMADWWERMREQHALLLTWAQAADQPPEMRQAIAGAEREAQRHALIARARAALWEREGSTRLLRAVA